jgi:hypothetical protein
MARRKPVRLVGHKLTVEFSGERSREERSSTGTCICGWSESASTGDEVRFEYRMHIQNETEKRDRYFAELDAKRAAERAAETAKQRQLEAAALIEGYESLRRRCYEYARADNGAALANSNCPRNALSEYDIFMDATEQGILCTGSSYSSATCGPEDFEFTVPYEALDA